ncbi:helix-turn-helix domain-containing protein [Actinomycetospora soli]|uniref:helix-turn-helix domain-containing protein n=1 Tax=Actinomycetospora soli TaxID=2893887 RepID=UPI001E382440|nr:helix-turn-helix domain-containing protein [Actinomycetospora soli]MCD2188623.1 helix-turn-helix domain-containing protein [Actinomycetospora soli]
MGLWDSGGLAPREQFAFWHEVICQAFVPLTPHRTLAEDGFAATVETRTLAGVNRARIRSRPQRTDHGPREVARTDAGFYFVNLQLRGRCATTVRGRTEVVEEGQFVVVDTAEPYFFDFDRPWQMVSYRVPHHLLAQPLAGRRPALGRPIGAEGAGTVVRTLMTTLWSVDEDAAGGDDLVRSFTSAVAAATAAPDERVGLTRSAVLAHVQAHLGGDLGVSAVCRRFAVSPRTLHNLFADGDESYAATVRRLRLDRCAAMLRDPGTTATVTALAAAHGFDDPTSFTRAFRRRFGVSPREVRAAARD